MESLSRYTLLFILVALISCDSKKSDATDNVPIENLQRPSDWSQTTRLSVTRAPGNDWPTWKLLYRSNSPRNIQDADSFEELLSQLWKIAFSGDAEVYQPSIFGELDMDEPLEPKALVDYLKRTDTAYIEDLQTGEIKEQVINSDFSESDVSALMVNMSLVEDNHSEIEFRAHSIGIGSRVFDTDGFYRGNKAEFFIKLNETDGNADLFSYRLNIETDSTGVFNFSAIQASTESTKDLMEAMKDRGFISEGEEYELSMSLDYRNRRLIALLRKQESV